MKQLKLLIIGLAFCAVANAQKNSSSATIKVDKNLVYALSQMYDVSKDIMEETVKTYFSNKGNKMKKSSGIYNASGVTFQSLNNKMFDVYVLVDKPKTSQTACTVTMSISSGYNNFMTDSDADMKAVVDQVLSDLRPASNNNQTQASITTKEKQLKDAQKKLLSYQKDRDEALKNIDLKEKEIEALTTELTNLKTKIN
jgi:ribonucleotide monophosphatase NagD (HAD superfamily)